MTAPRSLRTFAAGLTAILLLAAVLRGLFPTADPPWRTTVGVVWHDEGAWTHNARNRALFGEWRLDAWNPMFVAPVFTALEYGAFATFGVGTWQARTVSQIAGTLAVLLLALGIARMGGSRIGGARIGDARIGRGSPHPSPLPARGEREVRAWIGGSHHGGEGFDQQQQQQQQQRQHQRRQRHRLAALVAAAWLATNYVSVMYDRAAIMESLMAAFVVAGWYGFVRAQRSPRWGLWAGTAATLAYFTKAAAIFFIAALALTCLWSLIEERRGVSRPTAPTDVESGGRSHARVARVPPRLSLARLFQPSTYRLAPADDDDRPRAAAVWTLIGLALAGGVALAVFVAPFWSEYRFYNWQMSVTRKPSYDLRAIVDRVSWLPILHDVFTRMWFIWIVGLVAWIGRVADWRHRDPAERLLTLWVGVGVLELLLHDVGNERRFVFLLPALIALASLAIVADRRLLPPAIGTISRARALLAAPLVAYVAYLAAGALVRLLFLYDVRPNVRIAAALALAAAVLIHATWPRVPRWIAGTVITPRAVAAVALLVTAGHLAQYVQWAAGRTYANVEASRALGERLPPGTLVHGKLANGLALENRIRPIFVGRQFGNYDDRLTRDDVPYVLTYVAPREGYEGPVILDVLEHYPRRRILWTFDVRETTGGHDRAALIEKGPPGVQKAFREND